MPAGTFITEHEPKEAIINPHILYKMRLPHQTKPWNVAEKMTLYKQVFFCEQSAWLELRFAKQRLKMIYVVQ
jgi:hypothetical protein